VEQHRHAALPFAAAISTISSGPACPLCGGPTRQKKGRNGPFWSCGSYPECKGTASFAVDYCKELSFNLISGEQARHGFICSLDMGQLMGNPLSISSLFSILRNLESLRIY
jgi:ssDNA-binding Zn-finger/Zn-ribbon topoisomerase 1